MAQDTFTSSDTIGDVLVTKIQGDLTELFALISSIQSSIAALTVGTGCPVSANDSTPGFLNGKLVAGANLDFTESNDGGNETLTIELATTVTTRTYVDPVIIGCAKNTVYTITDSAAFEVDPSNGGIQAVTLGDNRTPKATNFENGEAIILMVNDGTAYDITWTDTTWGTSGVDWKTDGGAKPVLNTTGYTHIVLWKAFNQVYGARVGDN